MLKYTLESRFQSSPGIIIFPIAGGGVCTQSDFAHVVDA